MIIRDILFHAILKPYIVFNTEASWEYKDLFPVDRFDINPFDLEVGLTEENGSISSACTTVEQDEGYVPVIR